MTITGATLRRLPGLTRRWLLGAASATVAGLVHPSARDESRAGEKKRRRRCRAVCDGNCAECREICEASCESGCPRCYHRPGAGPFCGTLTVTHKCQFCTSSLECPPQHPFCFTGFTDQESGKTKRFSVCGNYPAGICADFVGCA